MRTAEEIRGTAKAWVEVHDTCPWSSSPGQEGRWLVRLWTREGDNLSARYGMQSDSFSSRADVPYLAIANARVLDIPAIYDDIVLYDPPDRLAALHEAELAEARKPWREALEMAVREAEARHDASVQAADWYNNNTPNVGQTVDYQAAEPLPEWVAAARALLDKEAK